MSNNNTEKHMAEWSGINFSEREAAAIRWFFSSEAGPLKVCEARAIIRERFGRDVEESLRQKRMSHNTAVNVLKTTEVE